MKMQRLLLSQKKLIVFSFLQQTGRQIVRVTLMTAVISGFVPLMLLTSTAWASADVLDSVQHNPTQERPELDITQSLLLCKELGNVDAIDPAQSTLPCEVLELDITHSLLPDESSHD